MKKAVTLKENWEFRRLYQKGKSAVGPAMVIYCKKNRLDHNRLGVTVSTKLGGAVIRNRARRRIREVYRLASPFEGNFAAFQFVEQDGSRVVAFIGSTLAEPASPYTVIRFRGLDPEARYRDDIGDIYTGSFLMNVGLYETPAEDFMTRIVILERV